MTSIGIPSPPWGRRCREAAEEGGGAKSHSAPQRSAQPAQHQNVTSLLRPFPHWCPGSVVMAWKDRSVRMRRPMVAWIRSQRPDSSKSKHPIGRLAATQHSSRVCHQRDKSVRHDSCFSCMSENGRRRHASPLGAEGFGDVRTLKF